jgi:hypothetical protein
MSGSCTVRTEECIASLTSGTGDLAANRASQRGGGEMLAGTRRREIHKPRWRSGEERDEEGLGETNQRKDIKHAIHCIVMRET